jgi:5'-methylthioinosine phosphorylase
MSLLAIIGGTGLTSLQTLQITRKHMVTTPWGEPSGPLTYGVLAGKAVLFLPRHGSGHTIPPHMVNYRANIWALRQVGASRVIAVAAVGGIHQELGPGQLAAPDQIIDYTYSRAHTFFEEHLSQVTHVDFTYPYCPQLRGALLAASQRTGVQLRDGGTYAATQGPRLESAAEIRRLQRDGCDMVGMTGMPEAVLAREAGLSYATCAVVANWAAGKQQGVIQMEDIDATLRSAMTDVRTLLAEAIALL